MMKFGRFREKQFKTIMGKSIMKKETLRLKLNNWNLQGLRSKIADMFRSIADSIENRNKNGDVDLMADVDDQRAHHFGNKEDFAELDDSA